MWRFGVPFTELRIKLVMLFARVRASARVCVSVCVCVCVCTRAELCLRVMFRCVRIRVVCGISLVFVSSRECETLEVQIHPLCDALPNSGQARKHKKT